MIETVLELSFNPLFTKGLIQVYTAIGTILLLGATMLHTNMVDKFKLHLSIQMKNREKGLTASSTSTRDEEQGALLNAAEEECATWQP